MTHYMTWLAAVLAFGTPAAATAHELDEAGATITIREGGHLELRLHVPWAQVLQRRLMPRATVEAFLAQAASQPAEAFAREVRAVEAMVERECVLKVAGRGDQPFARWTWPTPAEVQAALRRELMSRAVDGASFEHASRMPATAEVRLGRLPAGARVRFPEVMGPVLLTVATPRTGWVSPGQWSSPVIP